MNISAHCLRKKIYRNFRIQHMLTEALGERSIFRSENWTKLHVMLLGKLKPHIGNYPLNLPTKMWAQEKATKGSCCLLLGLHRHSIANTYCRLRFPHKYSKKWKREACEKWLNVAKNTTQSNMFRQAVATSSIGHYGHVVAQGLAMTLYCQRSSRAKTPGCEAAAS